jgi:hypothetical protein
MPPMQRLFFPLIVFGILNSVMLDNENGFVLLYNVLETINNLTQWEKRIFSISILTEMSVYERIHRSCSYYYSTTVHAT